MSRDWTRDDEDESLLEREAKKISEWKDWWDGAIQLLSAGEGTGQGANIETAKPGAAQGSKEKGRGLENKLDRWWAVTDELLLGESGLWESDLRDWIHGGQTGQSSVLLLYYSTR